MPRWRLSPLRATTDPEWFTYYDVPVHHCCLQCGFVPEEGLAKYIEIHGADASCAICGYPTIGSVDPYEPASEGEPTP